MNKVYDLLILGSGPAGITAGVYAARKRMDFKIVTLDIGGQAALSSDIENYTGYQFVTGPELAEKFRQHMEAFKIEVSMPEKVEKVSKEGNLIRTVTDKGEYLSRAVIIATGKRPRSLNVEGEEQFRARGVSYCATCDAPLFRDKVTAVIGGGNSALDAVLQLMKISPKVYVINITDSLTADPIMIEKAKNAQNVEILNSSRVKRIYGDVFVKGMEIEKEDRILNLVVEGIFVEIGLIPNSEFIDIASKNELGEITVDCYNRTSVEGIFAAGDVTSVPEKQIIIACGEGAKACLSAFKYLSTHRFG